MSDLDLLRHLGDQIVPPPLADLRETARARTRRTAAVISLSAAAAVVGVLVGLHAFSTSDHSAPPVKEPQAQARPLTYAQGATVHYGPQDVVLPARVVELDLTDEGAVARTQDGGIWFTDGGDPTQLGSLGTPGETSTDFGKGPGAIVGYGAPGFVVSGNVGPLVAWWEFQEQGPPRLVVFDTRAGRTTLNRAVDLRSGSRVLLDSVTATAVYWYVDPVAYELDAPDAAMDLSTGEQSVVTKAAYRNDSLPEGTPRTVLVSHAEGGGGPYVVQEGLLQLGLTHGGGHLVVLGEQPLEALDGATRTPFTFRVPPEFEPREAPAFLTQWLDDDTFVVAYKLDGPADLLTCAISSQSCEITDLSLEAVLPEIG